MFLHVGFMRHPARINGIAANARTSPMPIAVPKAPGASMK
jgi:hypothetical protein